MKKGYLFRGWTDVFHFTFKEVAGKKSFLIITLAIGFGLMLLISGIFAFISYAQAEGEDQAFPIRNVYVANDSDFPYIKFEKIEETSFHNSLESLETLQKKIMNSKEDALLHIEKAGGKNIVCNLIIPSSSDVLEGEGEEFLEKITGSIEQMKLVNVGIEPSKLQVLLSPVTMAYSVQGDEPESLGETLVKILVPIFFHIIIYFMVLLYGQSASKIVSSEKTSKLIDTLLLLVKPYALILGKIAAMTAVGMVQFFIWFSAILGGFFVGDAIGHLCNPKFSNPIYELFKLLRDTGAGEAFTVPSVLLGIFSCLLGFSFYMVVAGLVASRISKAEDLAQGVGIYQIVVIAGFFSSYFLLMNPSSALVKAAEWIPFTAAFLLPGKILLGGVSMLSGMGMVLVLCFFIFLMLVLTAKLYRKQVF